MTKSDSDEYLKQKKFYNQIVTIYGRKPVLEVINDTSIEIHKVHFSDSNKPADILKKIEYTATRRDIEIVYHSKQALSRISKNSKQDQGIAADVLLKGFIDADRFMATHQSGKTHFSAIALDSITNPQNLGMIIRSVCASPIDALIIPNKGCAKLDALVIKASAGTLFRAPIIRTDSLTTTLNAFSDMGTRIIGLEAKASKKLSDLRSNESKIFVLGNETEGLSADVKTLCDQNIGIKMKNNVESLNVAVTASLLAFFGAL